MTPYQVLGVESTATDNEIKKAYKSLVQQYHPDKPDGDADKFNAVREAYETLTDDETIRGRLVTIFSMILKTAPGSDAVESAVKMCHKNIMHLKAEKTKLEIDKESLAKQLNRIVAKKGVNVYQQVVGELIDKCNQGISDIDDELVTLDRTIVALENYEDRGSCQWLD